MFCDKTNVNQLTSLLIKHHIRDIVVCPGSRNAVLVHNFHINSAFRCYPITDERSATFVALGIALARQQPVAICLTSGSALLNTLPAVAEAYYQHIPLLIISADRPSCWIDQQDGQTIYQNGALAPYTKKSIQLTEPINSADKWWNNRAINEALLALRHNNPGPVHINVPISAPLFTFSTLLLPDERMIKQYEPENHSLPSEFIEIIKKASLPVLIIGQMNPNTIKHCSWQKIDNSNQILVLSELIGNTPYFYRTWSLESVLKKDFFQPDVILYLGGTFVENHLKEIFRNIQVQHFIRIGEESNLCDTFCQMTEHIRMSPALFIKELAYALQTGQYKTKVTQIKQKLQFTPLTISLNRYTDKGIMHTLGTYLYKNKKDSYVLHLANSSVVRNAAYLFCFPDFPSIPVYCNRGVNGIEGSLSTAVGFSIADTRTSICLIGDLSFFYDQNALWNICLKGNLRILLFNNHGGKIFYQLKGLELSPAIDPFIAGSHHTTAKNIAKTYNMIYLSASSYEELNTVLPQWMSIDSQKPVLLEVFTN